MYDFLFLDKCILATFSEMAKKLLMARIVACCPVNFLLVLVLVSVVVVLLPLLLLLLVLASLLLVLLVIIIITITERWSGVVVVR